MSGSWGFVTLYRLDKQSRKAVPDHCHEGLHRHQFSFDDLRTQYFEVIKGRVSFVFTDNEIMQDWVLEYINNFLSRGEVPGFFSAEDRDSASNDVRPIAKKDKPREFNDAPDYLWKYLTNRIRGQLHLVRCFSPIGDKFWTCVRTFPELVAYCTINRFFPWPREALPAVAAEFLNGFELETEGRTKQNLYGLVASTHDIVTDYTAEYFRTYCGSVCCTPDLGFINR